MKSVKKQALALKNDIEDAASFYVSSDVRRCHAGLVRAYKATERAFRTGKPEALKIARTSWRRAQKCLVSKTGYTHNPRRK